MSAADLYARRTLAGRSPRRSLISALHVGRREPPMFVSCSWWEGQHAALPTCLNIRLAGQPACMAQEGVSVRIVPLIHACARPGRSAGLAALLLLPGSGISCPHPSVAAALSAASLEPGVRSASGPSLSEGRAPVGAGVQGPKSD